ncbi:MAG: hypothetical protein JNG90_06805, partial [Planctomycetaceae bacterium]|nr:hypothetical protein [Planctomycetaceae bacterium]
MSKPATTRRDFFAWAGTGLAGAGLAAGGEKAPAAGDDKRAAELASAPGKIDCQSHLFCPELVKRMEARSIDPVVYRRGDDQFVRMGEWHRKILPNHMDVGAKLASMDR